MITDCDYRRAIKAAIGLLIFICLLAALASLSGCLTASKLMRWELAVYGWATAKDASAGCLDATAKASAYMVKANERLQTARAATDLELDTTARALMSAAARACGKELP